MHGGLFFFNGSISYRPFLGLGKFGAFDKRLGIGAQHLTVDTDSIARRDLCPRQSYGAIDFDTSVVDQLIGFTTGAKAGITDILVYAHLYHVFQSRVKRVTVIFFCKNIDANTANFSGDSVV